MKKILVTGNMGYVGPVAVSHFRRAFPGASLAGLDSAYFATCLSGAPVLPESILDEQIFGDVRSLSARALEGVDAIVHLAGISNDPIGNMFEQVTVDVNECASIELARRAKTCGVRRFVFASSCSVYGCAEEGARDENSAVEPLTAYARSKVAAEQGLAGLADESFAITCLRFATACGFSPRIRLDLVLNDFVARALTTGEIQILSDGTPWRPLIDVRDMALAMEWAMTRNAGDPYLIVNVGRDSANYRVRELADAVLAQIPGISVNINPHAAPDKRSYRVSFRRFETLAPGHQPRFTLADTIGELVRGLRSCDLRGADPYFRFTRLKFVSHLVEQGRLDPNLRWCANA